MDKELKQQEVASIKEFDAWSGSYDKDIWSVYFKASYERILSLLSRYHRSDEGVKILDAACGTGELSLMVANAFPNAEVIGIDISPQMIEAARKKGVEQKGNVSFAVGQIDTLPYEDDRFDIIFCLNAFHHFPEQSEALSALHRVLKPSGHFFLLDNITDGILRKAWIPILKKVCNEKDVLFHNKAGLSLLLSDAGFKIIDQVGNFYFTEIFITKKV